MQDRNEQICQIRMAAVVQPEPRALEIQAEVRDPSTQKPGEGVVAGPHEGCSAPTWALVRAATRKLAKRRQITAAR